MPQPGVIAIVDDEKEVRLSTGNLLRAYGLRTEAFESADAFLRALDPARTACLITDVHMPGMNGLELLDALNGMGARFPVMVISALESEQTRAAALAKGADAFLPKPLDADALIAWLERVRANR